MSIFDFQATIASRGYHVCTETTWSNAKVSEKVETETKANQSSIAMDPYACAVKAKEKYFDGWKTVGYVSREISRYMYFFIKKRKWKNHWQRKIVKLQAVTYSFWRLEIPLQLTFSCPVEWFEIK